MKFYKSYSRKLCIKLSKINFCKHFMHKFIFFKNVCKYKIYSCYNIKNYSRIKTYIRSLNAKKHTCKSNYCCKQCNSEYYLIYGIHSLIIYKIIYRNSRYNATIIQVFYYFCKNSTSRTKY